MDDHRNFFIALQETDLIMFNFRNIFAGLFLVSILVFNIDSVFGYESVGVGANSNSQTAGTSVEYATGPGTSVTNLSATGACTVTPDNRSAENYGGFIVNCTGAGTCNVTFDIYHSISDSTDAGNTLTVTQSSGGGCLIATATYGTELAPQVQQLREIRDNMILKTNSGMAFMTSFNQFYYSFSPDVADFEREHPAFKEMMKITITPFISSLSILNYVDMDSDVEVLGYLSGLALLNLGMYVGIPIIGIVGIKKKLL